MDRLALFNLVLFFVVDVSTSAIAQQAGDAGAGATYAKQYCSKCHAIGETETSPEPKAPRFKNDRACIGCVASQAAPVYAEHIC